MISAFFKIHTLHTHYFLFSTLVLEAMSRVCCQFILPVVQCRFSPQLKVLNYSGGKESREEEQARIMDTVSAQEWSRRKFPFHILLAHYEVVVLFSL